MNIKLFNTIIVVSIIFSSCAFTPKVSDKQTYAKACNMFTKKLDLNMTEIKSISCHGDLDACILAYGVVVPAGSLVLSGGVILAGNTLHWLEYQGTCEDGILRKSFSKLKSLVGLGN